MEFRKLIRFFAFLVIAVASATAQVSVDEQIRLVTEKFKAAAVKVNNEEQAALHPVTVKYITELERIRETERSKGNLDGVTDAEAAIAAASLRTPPPNAKVLGPTLLQARVAYEKNAELPMKQYAATRDRITAEFVRSMSDLEQRTTRNGNLEEAKKVRGEHLKTLRELTGDVLADMAGAKVEKDGFFVVKDGGGVRTTAKFAPPIEITYVLKTDGQIRLGYAAGDIIFNWEVNKNELRVDGGPADKQHRKNAGSLPVKEMMVIRQVVFANRMSISIDGKERGSWKGDFSGVSDTISIRPVQATISLKQILVKKLP